MVAAALNRTPTLNKIIQGFEYTVVPTIQIGLPSISFGVQLPLKKINENYVFLVFVVTPQTY